MTRHLEMEVLTGNEVSGAEWDSAIRAANVFSSDPFIRVVEAAADPENMIHRVLVRRNSGQLVAAACVYTTEIDLLVLSSGATRAMLRVLGTKRLRNARVLVCGLPVSTGSCQLLLPAERSEEVFRLLDQTLMKLARQVDAVAVVIKELNQARADDTTPLRSLGYHLADSLPTWTLRNRWSSFDEYLQSIRSRNRNDIGRSLRKMKRAGLVVRAISDSDAIRRVYTDEVHSLYDAVVNRAEVAIDRVPRSFFLRLADAFPESVRLQVVARDDDVLAFNWSLLDRGDYYFLFCGVDYDRNRTADLYFNVMYADLAAGLERADRIVLGQTADSFKARLGATAARRFLYLKGVSTMARVGLSLTTSFLFPPVELPATRSVFVSSDMTREKV